MSQGEAVTVASAVTHGQRHYRLLQAFAEVEATVEPNPGGGIEVIFELHNVVSRRGGVCDAESARSYCEGFEAGVRGQEYPGRDYGPRVTDVRVTLLSATADEVDSSYVAFKSVAVEWLAAAVRLVGAVDVAHPGQGDLG